MKNSQAWKSRWVVVPIILTLVALLAVSCGDDSVDAPSAAVPAAAVVPEPTAAPAAPAAPTGPSGTLTVRFSGDTETMDPQVATHTAFGVGAAFEAIFDTLTLPDDDLNPENRLAISWETPDATTWIFKLRDDVTFHNGEKLDAAAVVYSLDRMLDPDVRSVRNLKREIGYVSSEVVDPYTVQINTAGFAATMFRNLPFYFIMPPGLYTGKTPAETSTMAVGSGAFLFDSWTRDDSIKVTANPDYWLEDTPLVENVVFKIIPDTSAALAALETGLVDVVSQIPTDLHAQIEANANLNLFGTASLLRQALGISTDRAYLQDKRVRQALALAIDRQTIIDTLFAGQATPMKGMAMGPKSNPAITGWSFDPAKARELLAAAEWDSSITLELSLPIGRYQSAEEASQAIAQMWSDVGVKAEVKPTEWGVYRDWWVARTMTDIYYQGGQTSGIPQQDLQIMAPGYIIQAMHWDKHTSEGRTFAGLWEQLVVEPNEDRRQRLSFTMEELAFDSVPIIPLWQPNLSYGVTNRVTNFVARADGWVFVHKLGVKD